MANPSRHNQPCWPAPDASALLLALWLTLPTALLLLLSLPMWASLLLLSLLLLLLVLLCAASITTAP
jgi:hypothetical protein